MAKRQLAGPPLCRTGWEGWQAAISETPKSDPERAPADHILTSQIVSLISILSAANRDQVRQHLTVWLGQSLKGK